MVVKEYFGELDNNPVHRYVLRNNKDMQVAIIEYGAIVQRIVFTDKAGTEHDMILGFDNLDDYRNDEHYIGAMVGRYANRIANGTYCYDDQLFELQVNAPPHQLHGGEQGLHNLVWQGNTFTTDNSQAVVLTAELADQASGFPGDVSVTVKYELFDDNRLVLTKIATSTQTTPINLTNHAYFTLGQRASIESLLLAIQAQSITPSDPSLIPTGDYLDVANSPFDFRKHKPVGVDLRQPHSQLAQGSGYDHNYVLDAICADLTTPAASVINQELGIEMQLFTSKPGLQFYSGNFIHESDIPALQQHGALCLEPQYFPDSVNQPHFPSCWLHPGDEYKHVTAWTFAHI